MWSCHPTPRPQGLARAHLLVQAPVVDGAVRAHGSRAAGDSVPLKPSWPVNSAHWNPDFSTDEFRSIVYIRKLLAMPLDVDWRHGDEHMLQRHGLTVEEAMKPYSMRRRCCLTRIRRADRAPAPGCSATPRHGSRSSWSTGSDEMTGLDPGGVRRPGPPTRATRESTEKGAAHEAR